MDEISTETERYYIYYIYYLTSHNHFCLFDKSINRFIITNESA